MRIMMGFGYPPRSANMRVEMKKTSHLKGLSKPSTLEAGQDREVARVEGVQAGAEDVGDGALEEDGGLALAHGQLGALLDLLAVDREAVERVFRSSPVHSMISMN